MATKVFRPQCPSIRFPDADSKYYDLTELSSRSFLIKGDGTCALRQTRQRRSGRCTSVPAALIPNPDAGTAKILAGLGYEALATTSLGVANMLGRATGKVSRAEVIDNAREIVEATDLPVNADLENCFAHEPAAAAETIRLAAEAGLAGGSIEDYSGDAEAAIYDFDLRSSACVPPSPGEEPAGPFVLTARAENLIRGRNDMADTIRRLKAYAAAGRRCSMRPASGPQPRSAPWSRRRPAAERGDRLARARRHRCRRRGGRGQAHQRRRRAQPAGARRLRRCGAGDEGGGLVRLDAAHRRHEPAAQDVRGG